MFPTLASTVQSPDVVLVLALLSWRSAHFSLGSLYSRLETKDPTSASVSPLDNWPLRVNSRQGLAAGSKLMARRDRTKRGRLAVLSVVVPLELVPNTTKTMDVN